MPGAKEPIAKEAPAVNQTRRTSIGRAAKDQLPVQVAGVRKRKLSIETDPNKKGKSLTGTPMASGSAKEAEASGGDGFSDLKKMMLELSAKMGDVRSDIGAVKVELSADIGAVKHDLSAKIEEGKQATMELRKRMDDDEATFADRVAAVVANLPGSVLGLSDAGQRTDLSGDPTSRSYASCVAGPPSLNAQNIAKMDLKEDAYWKCRRSLRMWPVAGAVGADVRKAVGLFLKNRLRLEPSFLTSMGEIAVEPVPFTSRSKIQGEAIVSFGTTEIRDIVKRAAKELAGCRDAGIRLEVPRFLQPSLKSLEAVSYALKQKHPAMRRNIKFDDAELDLVLDLCLDPSDPDPKWKKIRPAQAALFRAKATSGARSEEMSTDDLGRMLGNP